MSGADRPLGQIAYEAYGDNRGWITANHGTMPQWADQRPELQDAWQASAIAVAIALRNTPAGVRVVVNTHDHREGFGPIVWGCAIFILGWAITFTLLWLKSRGAA